MSTIREGTLRVPGASIFYRTCGKGLPLLILAGGDTDADMTNPLRDALAERYRVITYDRRGLSRSVIDAGAPAPGIETHADDAHCLLAELSEEPALVFGNSIGGFSGLDLVARHPEQVRLLVAHEAPSAELLPPDDRQAMAKAQAEMQAAFRDGGIAAAMKKSAELAGIDPEDREPDIAPPPMTPQREKNVTFLLASDVPHVVGYRLDVPALLDQAAKIVPAAGRSTERTLLHHCAAALARTLNRPLVIFPGGHTGWLLRPKAFATTLAETFAQSGKRDEGSTGGQGEPSSDRAR